LTDPPSTDAPKLLEQVNEDMARFVREANGGAPANDKISVESGKGELPPNQPVPRSDSGPLDNQPGAADPNGIPVLKPIAPEPSTDSAAGQALPPTQINEVQQGADPAGSSSSSVSGTPGSTDTSNASSTTQAKESPDTYSTNKQKKKKGLRKIIPF